jgi:RHS repeat-associated protein
MTIPDILTSGKSTSSKYDLAGRLSQVTTPSGEIWNHSYLANGWLSSSSTTALNVAYTYNARGFLTSLTNSSVSHSSVLSSYTGLNYDALGNRQGFAAYLPQQAATVNGTPTTYAADASFSSLFSYDTAHVLPAQNRDVLTQEGRNATVIGSFSYDAAYNDVPVNADNQITSNNSIFDGQGNPSIYNNVPLTFDAENRLTAINNNEFFAYDGAGRRVSKTLNGVTTYYNYSGSTLLSEDTFPTSGTPYSVLYQYAADGLRSAYYPTTSASSYRAGLFDFVFDPQGNLVQRLDSTESGVLPGIDKEITYSAYGSPQTSTPVASPNGNIYSVPGGATPTSIGFGGKYGYYTDESGLILLGARYYDPATHRFLNRDPIDYKGGPNLYAYCDGNPVNEVDPEGTSGAGGWSGVGGYWSVVKQVFGGYGDLLNPIKAVEGVGQVYQAQKHMGAGELGSDLIHGVIHAFTDWGTTDDPRKFGTSAGTVLLAATGVGASKAAVTGAVDGAVDGAVSINFAGYPKGLPQPTGPFNILTGTDYEEARALANATNKGLRVKQGLVGKPVEIHEIHPVKFGGSPTNLANKVILPKAFHRQQVTPWWNKTLRELTKSD